MSAASRQVAPEVRCNLVTSLADLTSRWPNVLEPWTPQMYSPLQDIDPRVQRCALSTLNHLVLGGTLKAKGHVAKVALLLVADDQGEVWNDICFAMRPSL